MESENIKCKCQKTMKVSEFKTHFQKCKDFRNTFKTFDHQFGEILKQFSEPSENLPIIKFLLFEYISVLNRKIQTRIAHKNSNPSISIDNPSQKKNINLSSNEIQIQHQNSQKKKRFNESNSNQNQNNSEKYQKENENKKQRNKSPQRSQIQKENIQDYENSIFNLVCQKCKSPDFNYLECFHPMCLKCFNEFAEKDFPNMKCNVCQEPIKEDYKKQVLGKEKYEKYEKNALMGLVGQIIECPNCHELNSFESGTINYNIKDDQGNLLSKKACEEYANNRCRCITCNENFCIKCKSIPYHIGKTCEENLRNKKAEKCRFDQTEINDDNRGPDNDVCNNPECIERYENSCKKKLKCGHKCFGVNGEKSCPPCLNKQCKGYKNYYDQDMDAYCNICYTESLSSAPVVLLSCNHYVHYHCIKKRLESKWIGPKITFNHCLCPACNKWYSCPQVPDIQKLIDENKQLYDEICEMALKRLKYEGLDKDPQLTDPKSKWYNQKLEFALKRLSYYLCYVCKKPYFAGRRECGDGPDVNNENPNKIYDPKDLVCGKDANLNNVAGKTSCDKHGKEFIEYKCRFCCKIASWFCWGTTHFCEDCHARQCAGDYINKYPKDKLPKCDKANCEVGGNHPPNGEEYALGCSICRSDVENYKDF